MAEWRRSGLQIRVHEFDSRSRLQALFPEKLKPSKREQCSFYGNTSNIFNDLDGELNAISALYQQAHLHSASVLIS